jgi:hypothetical protein
MPREYRPSDAAWVPARRGQHWPGVDTGRGAAPSDQPPAAAAAGRTRPPTEPAAVHPRTDIEGMGTTLLVVTVVAVSAEVSGCVWAAAALAGFGRKRQPGCWVVARGSVVSRVGVSLAAARRCDWALASAVRTRAASSIAAARRRAAGSLIARIGRTWSASSLATTR